MAAATGTTSLLVMATTIGTISMLTTSTVAKTGIFDLREIDESESQGHISFFVLLFVLIMLFCSNSLNSAIILKHYLVLCYFD